MATFDLTARPRDLSFEEQGNRALAEVETRGEPESDTPWPVCLNNKAGRGARDSAVASIGSNWSFHPKPLADDALAAPHPLSQRES